jgi:hypothetical protein
MNTYICLNCWTASGLLFPPIVSGNMTAYQQKKWTKHHSPGTCYGWNSVFGSGFDLVSYFALLAAAHFRLARNKRKRPAGANAAARQAARHALPQRLVSCSLSEFAYGVPAILRLPACFPRASLPVYATLRDLRASGMT